MVEAVDASLITIPETDLDEGDYDPFKVFDEGQGAGQENPYPMFAEKRREAPVEKVDIRAMMGLDSDDELPEELRNMADTFTVFSFEHVTEVLRSTDRFNSSGYQDMMGLVFGHSILEMDGEEHTRHRALVAQAFRPKVLELWHHKLIDPVITEQLKATTDQAVEEIRSEGQGRAELTGDFTFVYPVKVIAGLLGVPLDHWDWFRRRAVETISLGQNFERATTAAQALRDYFTQIIHLRREDPADDLISQLVQAEINDPEIGRHSLSDEEILPFLMLLSPAGAETTFRSTGNLLYGLFTNPDQYEAVKEDRDLLVPAIEEAIRWEAPLTFIQRKALVDTELNGVPVPEGASMAVGIGSANHDEKVWGETSEEFDIFRERKQSVAFATGPHMCLGMHLARLEMLLACNALFDHLPNLRLDPDTVEDTFIDGVAFRSPNQLQVVWDA